MALATAQLELDIVSAFATTLWSEPVAKTGCAEKIGKALDDYIKTGQVEIELLGIPWTIPGGASGFADGLGKSAAIVTTGLTTLQTTLGTKFTQLVPTYLTWEEIGEEVANAFDLDVATASAPTINYVESGTYKLIGTGAAALGSFDTSAIISVYVAALKSALNVIGRTWAQIANDIATATEVYLKGLTVTVTGSTGASPGNWSVPSAPGVLK